MEKNFKYYFGKGEYKDVLTCLATTKVNSYKTSSLPLAEFWNPDKQKKNLDKFIKKLEENGLSIAEGNRFFEYPTPCRDENGDLPHSKPSMTDLMIINDKFQVAIEAKYTEYSDSSYQTIKDWEKGESHKTKIKEQWFKYILDCKATNQDKIDNTIPYQFLHRTASACYNCYEKIPVLVYQIFYDKDNKERKDQFIKELESYAKQLGFTEKILFYIVEIEIKNIEEVEKKYNGVRSDLFLIMRELKEPIYSFEWSTIKINKYDSIRKELIKG
ncbi:MAG: hypothetical protein J5747_06690 [Spirochaetaceae bacterium]|nr:hypothetical protein [Spirochaetaceae bacterium]